MQPVSCGKCGSAAPEDAKFCGNCGAPIQKQEPQEMPPPGLKCWKCGLEMDESDEFCSECGAPSVRPKKRSARFDNLGKMERFIVGFLLVLFVLDIVGLLVQIASGEHPLSYSLVLLLVFPLYFCPSLIAVDRKVNHRRKHIHNQPASRLDGDRLDHRPGDVFRRGRIEAGRRSEPIEEPSE